MQDGALEVQDGPWKLPKAKLDGNLVANMTQVGPKRGQEGPRVAKIEAKRGHLGLRGELSKPRGGGQAPPKDQRSLSGTKRIRSD